MIVIHAYVKGIKKLGSQEHNTLTIRIISRLINELEFDFSLE